MNTKEMVAYCGMDCTECPTYQATQNNDNNARAEVARFYSGRYKINVDPQDINCDGCLPAGKQIMGYCRECEIRKCGIERKVMNCGYCSDYPCDRLNKVHKIAVKAKNRLDNISNTKQA
jgi:hypothetical protein